MTFTYRLPIWLAFAGILAGALADLACPLAASADTPAITLSLDKYAGFAPLDVTARIRITQHPDNRFVCVYVSGPVRETSSCFPHEPDALSQRIVQFARLPEGEYAIWAVLVQTNNRETASSAATLIIQ